jgi:hypothetical protein
MDFDARGLFNFTKGDIVSRHGMTWKVASVEYQDEGNRKLIPSVWVRLTRVLTD